MSRRICSVLVGSLAVVLCSAGVRQLSEPPEPRANLQWVGEWELSGKLNEMLGFSDEQSRLECVYVFPESFSITFSKKIGVGMSPDLLEMYRAQVFKRLRHRIVATGKWETKFEIDPDIDQKCFITEHDGATYLWVAAPYSVLYGGRVSFLEGATQKHDAMVIDFNIHPDHLSGEVRAPDTVAYKRKSR